VDRLDLAIEPGALYGFLGPNGAGKTTTIRMLLGLVQPTEGQVALLGESVVGPRGRDVAPLARVGAIIEEPAFWRYLSGPRNLAYLATAAGPRKDRDARLARIEEVLRLVGLSEVGGKKVKAYSHGMVQRLGIALALLGRPELLVLDEPTNGLDPQGRREVRTLLRRLTGEGITVFVSSHMLAEVEAMCDVVGVLARGRLVAEGPPSSLRSVTPGAISLDVDDLDRACRVLETVEGVRLDGVERSQLRLRLTAPATPASVNRVLVESGVGVSALVPERETLEEVFVSLVEGADVPR
jgi:ABC-2 type transport system ATP-binding protein